MQYMYTKYVSHTTGVKTDCTQIFTVKLCVLDYKYNYTDEQNKSM